MNLELEQTAKRRVIKEGFFQSYTASGDFEILLSDIKKGTLLDSHNHEFVQFGYCFNNRFTFIIEGKNYKMSADMSVILPSFYWHSAIAEDNYKFLDFKFIDDSYASKNLAFDVFSKGITDKGLSTENVVLGKSNIFKLYSKKQDQAFSLAVSDDCVYYLVSGEEVSIETGGSEQTINSMEIYKVSPKAKLLEIKIKDINKTLFIIAVHKKLFGTGVIA